MNVYDEAHKLARAVKESGEFQQYDMLKKKIDETPELAEVLKDFQEKQIKLQAKQMMGEDVGDMSTEIQKLAAVVMANPQAAEYLQAQMRFTLMMNDVYKILADAIGIGNIG